jgi:hypothetical protein
MGLGPMAAFHGELLPPQLDLYVRAKLRLDLRQLAREAGHLRKRPDLSVFSDQVG